MFKKIWEWLVKSSADPTKTSASIKFALLGVVPYIIHLLTLACGFGLVCLGVDTEWLNQFVEVLSQLVFWILSIISAIGFLYGSTRKVYLTAKGQNPVLKK